MGQTTLRASLIQPGPAHILSGFSAARPFFPV